jgi:hypothetical protein
MIALEGQPKSERRRLAGIIKELKGMRRCLQKMDFSILWGKHCKLEDGAEGGNRPVSPLLEYSVPFEGVFGKAA